MEKVLRIAVVLETFAEHGRAVMRGVASYLERGRAWQLRFIPLGRNNTSILKSALNSDGVITWPSTDDLAEVLSHTKTPTVAVHYHGDDLPIPCVNSNPHSIARMVCEHLWAQGFRQFGYYGALGRRFSMDRAAAFEQAVHALGSLCYCLHRPRIDPETFDWHMNDDVLIAWLRNLPKPIGILAANDVMAQQLLLCALHGGVRVPDDVAIVGIDNDELLCRLTFPPLSSIDDAGERVGFEAAALLDRLLNGENVGTPKLRLDPIRLVVRQSSDVLSVSDPNVAEAMRHIRLNASRQNFSVEDVLRAVPIARRTLELSFRKLINRSIHEEITECRLSRAKQLLVETDLSIPDIAQTCGFSNRTHMNVVFTRHTAEPPAAYRRMHRRPR